MYKAHRFSRDSHIRDACALDVIRREVVSARLLRPRLGVFLGLKRGFYFSTKTRATFNRPTCYARELRNNAKCTCRQQFIYTVDQLKGKLQLAFTCKKCNSRNHKIITKKAYEKGVVIVRCEGCKNNHLIADNLGWFQGSGPKNIEKLLKEKGEHVRRIRDDSEGYFEVLANEELKMIQQAMKEVRSESSETPKDQEPEIHKVQYKKVGQEQK
ncbi:unnamed protein product [Trichogramma brassicae]|uniref:DNL-type domain-containing protein n=1 Tax=Trichogramma brassicae TaxID=86971 RepID=A0A6H5IXA9_9HYME|nr:unnamed protein product [Trichogramma brassicae]